MKRPKIKRNLNLSVIFFVFLAFSSSCTSKRQWEIGKLLGRYQESVNKGDSRTFLSCFDPNYLDSFFPPESALAGIKKELSNPYPPSLEISGSHITLTGDRALIKQKFVLRRIKAGQGREDQGVEELALARTREGWKIVSGSLVYQFLAGRALEEDEIKGILEKRIRALRDKNIEVFKELVDPEYNFKGKDYKRVISEMEGNFRDYERIELILDRPRMTFFKDRADVVEGYQLKVWYKGTPREFNDTERLEFKKTSQGWKISKGL